MWFVLGTGAIIFALWNIRRTVRNQNAERFRFASLALTALTLCAFYSDGAGRVTRGDWAGLMDTMPTMNQALWVCTGISILINSVSLFREKK